MTIDFQELAKYVLAGGLPALILALGKIASDIRKQNAINRVAAINEAHVVDEEKDEWREEMRRELRRCREEHQALYDDFTHFRAASEADRNRLRDEIGDVRRINADLRAENARLAGQVNTMSGILDLLKEQIATPAHGLTRPPAPDPEP